MFDEALNLYKNQELDESQLCALSFLAMGIELRGPTFVSRSCDRHPPKYFLTLSKPEMALFFEKAQFKQVKAKAVTALQKWLADEWPLTLYFDIPAVIDVLRLQAEGSRPVTVFLQRSQWSLPKLDKDNAFEFLVHDLEHAFQYFSFIHEEQRRLNRFLLGLYDKGYFNELKASKLEDRMNYLLSDMNTHSAHALAYLKSIWVDYYKEQGFDHFEALLESKMQVFTEFETGEAIS